ncbi:hypothetical protein HPP92_027692 [Vanilla planifolia]|uniref:Uncharacterized protein n=1 Tax=Vanilla planifolia TaxID=51239 RepID=A0A835PAW5_VANPL|nr:hypothetical protein HPP92_027692 [Vanilla planifolia]
MELNYVKEHCYKTCIRPDDPIWKLFKSGSGKSLSSSIPTTLEASRKADVLDSVNVEKNIINSPEEILQSDSTANKVSALQNSGLFKLCTRKSVDYAKHRNNDITFLCEESDRIGEDGCDLSMISEGTEQNTQKSKDDNTSCERNLSYIGSSKRMNASLRRVYRSMNVPVPRPLPSLLELMRSRKRIYSGACNV